MACSNISGPPAPYYCVTFTGIDNNFSCSECEFFDGVPQLFTNTGGCTYVGPSWVLCGIPRANWQLEFTSGNQIKLTLSGVGGTTYFGLNPGSLPNYAKIYYLPLISDTLGLCNFNFAVAKITPWSTNNCNSGNVKFFYSGAGTGINPNLSLGGAISSQEAFQIFDDLTAKQSRAGLVDYRCLYVKNTHSSLSWRNVKFYVDWERKSGSLVDVGVVLRTEIQTVGVKGPTPPNENDFMTLYVPTYGQFTVPYHINITEWQGRFQTAMRGLDGLRDIQVDVAGETDGTNGTDVVFTVKFLGQADSRNVAPMTVIDNSLDSQIITINEIQAGSPISVTACTIPNILTAPGCTDFSYPLRGSPIELGNLRPNDAFPVWLRRTTPIGTRIKLLDKIRFNVEGTFP